MMVVKLVMGSMVFMYETLAVAGLIAERCCSNLMQLGALAAYLLEHRTACASSSCPSCEKDLAISKVMHSVASHDEPLLKPNKTPDTPTEVDPMHGAVGKLAGDMALDTGIFGAA
jgi:hypothetical protein